MKLVYLGSPEVAVPPLRALVSAGHDVVLVVSQPDRRRGRGADLIASPVKRAAIELSLPVSDRVADVHEAVAAGAELGVVVAFGRLIKPDLLDVLPFVNLHFSLLPRWRGAAPMERALLNGDPETGVCLMALEEGLDTGGVYRRVVTPIGDDETAQQLRSRLVEIATSMLVDALSLNTVAGLGYAQPQTGTPTWAQKFSSSDYEIDWAQSAIAVHRLVRLGTAWTTFRGKRLKVLRASVSNRVPESGSSSEPPGTVLSDSVTCGSGEVELLDVQPEGKPAMSARAWRNGAQLKAGERLGRGEVATGTAKDSHE